MVIGFYRRLVMLSFTSFGFINGSLILSQVVGTKDMTQELLSSQTSTKSLATNQKHEYCIPGGGHADGEIITTDGSILTLSISKAELVIIDQKPNIDMTITLKNHGIGSALIPWSSSPVEPAQLPNVNNMETTGYEVATIDFYIGRNHIEDKSLVLRSHVALWSQPDNLTQSIKLRAGESVELKVRAGIFCRLNESTSCIARLRESKLQVSAWWYQRLLSTMVKESCIFGTSAYTEREIDSSIVDVESTPIQTSQKIDIPLISQR
jgi:hypothetical protein